MKRRKLLSKAAAMMTAVLLVFGVSGQMVSAAEESAEQIGYITVQPRGVYLQSGFSKISKPGDGKITAGGNTTAQKVVSEVSIDVFVERKVNGSWKHYTSRTATKQRYCSYLLQDADSAEGLLLPCQKRTLRKLRCKQFCYRRILHLTGRRKLNME